MSDKRPFTFPGTGRTRLFAKLLLLLGSILVATTAAEITVRWVRPGYVSGPAPAGNAFWRHDPDIGWLHRPGQTGTFSRPEFTHGVTINGMGFRDRERKIARGADRNGRRLRIVVLGDSFTWGHGVEDEELFTRLLEDHLPGTEVWNLGVSAYSTDQELLLLRKESRRIDPDLVLVMLTRNDFSGNMKEAYGAYYKPRFLEADGRLELIGVPVPRPSVWIRSTTWLRRRSAFVNGLFHVTGQKVPKAWRPHGGWDEQLRITRGILDQFSSESAAIGARLAIGLVPSVAHVYFEEVLKGEARGSKAILDWGAKAGVEVLDMTPAFRQEYSRTGQRFHYRRDKHWNRAGHRLAAEVLASLLRRSGLLQRPEEAGDHPRPGELSGLLLDPVGRHGVDSRGPVVGLLPD